jgi:hypothetical protein
MSKPYAIEIAPGRFITVWLDKKTGLGSLSGPLPIRKVKGSKKERRCKV